MEEGMRRNGGRGKKGRRVLLVRGRERGERERIVGGKLKRSPRSPSPTHVHVRVEYTYKNIRGCRK